MSLLARQFGMYGTPDANVPPPVKTLWWPLMTGTGVVDGSTTPSGFVDPLGNTAVTRNEPAVMDVHSGTRAWQATGGLKFETGGRTQLNVFPTGAAEIYMRDVLDLSDYLVDQTLLVAFEIEVPTGWVGSSDTMVSVGDHAVSQGGGYSFTLNSDSRAMMVFRAKDASANAAIINQLSANAAVANTRNAVIFEIVCIEDGMTFKVRAHLKSSGGEVDTGTWSDDTDFTDPANGGTEAPGMSTTATFTIGGRRDTTATGSLASILNADEIIRNVWAAKFGEPPIDGFVANMASDMIAHRGWLPRSLRYYTGYTGSSEIGDGNWNAAISPITAGDMYLAIVPSLTFDSGAGETIYDVHPQFSAVTEAYKTTGESAGTFTNVFTSVNTTAQPHYSAVATPPGTQHVATPAEGTKFGHSTTGPDGVTPAFLCASYNTDINNRRRCEMTFRAAGRAPDQTSSNVSFPVGVDVWVALRVWYDFDMDFPTFRQHAVLCQFHHMMQPVPTGGVNPYFTIAVYGDHLGVQIWGSATAPLTSKVPVIHDVDVFPATDMDEYRGRWIEIVIKTKLSSDAADNPYTKVWVDGTQIVNYSGINCYAQHASQPQLPELRFGIYPGQHAHSPVVDREVWISRALCCTNVGNYTSAQIRAALTTPITTYTEA